MTCVSPADVEGIAISSVVPAINFTIEHMCQNYFHQQPMIVAPGIKTGINIKYENPRELGKPTPSPPAVAAYTEYGGPCIYIDFGTATTFGVVDEEEVVPGWLHLSGDQGSLGGIGLRHRQAPPFRHCQAGRMLLAAPP